MTSNSVWSPTEREAMGDRRDKWTYLTKIKRLGLLIQPEKIKLFEELNNEFGSSLQEPVNAPATPRTVPVKPIDEEPTTPKIDKGKGRAIDLSPKPSETGSIISSTNTVQNGGPKYTTTPALPTDAERLKAERLKAEQMKYALQLQREQGRGDSKSKSAKAGPSTPARNARRPGSAASTSSTVSRQTVFAATKPPALKPVASAPATNGSLKTPSKPAAKVDIPFAPGATASSVSTCNAFTAAPTTHSRSLPAATSVTRSDSGVSLNGSSAGELNGATTTPLASVPTMPAARESTSNGHDAQAIDSSKTVPPHLRTASRVAQPDTALATHEGEVKDKTAEKANTGTSSPPVASTNGFDDSRHIMKTSIAQITKLEKQVAELIEENKALRKKFVSLEEKVDLLNAGGPSIMKPFMATVKYPCGNVDQIQIRGNMRVNELLEHAVAKRSIDLGQSSYLKLSYEGEVLGHLLYIGQVQPTRDGLFEISRA